VQSAKCRKKVTFKKIKGRIRTSSVIKSLNFVAISKKLEEFSVKQDVEKFLPRVQLKAFFHDKQDDSNTSDKNTFESLQIRKSKWTLPEGQFASLDFFLLINAVTVSINLISIVTPNFATFLRKRGRHLENLSKR